MDSLILLIMFSLIYSVGTAMGATKAWLSMAWKLWPYIILVLVLYYFAGWYILIILTAPLLILLKPFLQGMMVVEGSKSTPE